MPAEMAEELRKRQNPLTNGRSDSNGYNGYNGAGQLNWWWTPAGIATRYAIVAVLFGSVILYFVVGYLNAQRRLRKGLPLRRWNGWMVRRPAPNWNPPRNVVYAHHGDPNNQYMMEGYPPPPPAYNNAEGPPPTYQPPPGASKAMADQNFRETTRAGEGSGSAGTAAPPTVHP